jgi:hypothetical protein
MVTLIVGFLGLPQKLAGDAIAGKSDHAGYWT